MEIAFTSGYFTESSYKKHPLKYWSHVIGYEGENSLLSALKYLGLAEGLSSGYDDVMGNSSIFFINVKLTENGLAQYTKVLNVVFSFLKKLRENGAAKYIFEEEYLTGKQDFDATDREESMDYAHQLTANMQLFAPVDVIKGLSFSEEYDEELLNKTINAFTVDNLRIFLTSLTLAGECNETEKYYGAKYSK